MALTDIDGGRLADNAFSLGKNLIINGAMQVAQRGTTSTGQGYQTVDRFRNITTTLTATQSRQSLSSGDPYDEGLRFFYRQENTSTSTAAGARIAVYQRIENQNISQSGWNYTNSNSYITLSFWVRASVAQTYYAQITTQDTSGYNYPMSFALSANTWTKVTKQIPGNSNLSFTTGNDIGLALFFVPFFGTDRTDSGVSVDTWAAYANGTQLPDMTTTWANTANATFDITGVQLEVGSVATPFEHRSFGDELVRCQRYYEKSYDYGTAPGTSTSTGLCSVNATTVTNGYRYYSVEFAVEKRGTPVITTYAQNGTLTEATNAAGTNLGANSAEAALACTKNFAVRNNRGSNITVTTNCVAFHYQADAEL
jgi:hypothetical protein